MGKILRNNHKAFTDCLILFLFISTSFLLLASDSILSKLGLLQRITEYRWLVGVLFIIAVVWLSVTSLIWLRRWGYREWSMRRRLHALTVDERGVLSGYVVNQVRTQTFVNVPDLGAAQGLCDDGILSRPEVVQDGVAVTYNIQERALDYLSANRGLLGAVVPGKPISIPTKSPDWFARWTALSAIILTIIGLYFTHRTYNFQTKTYQEGLEERILVRLGLDRDIEKSDGYIAVQVVNIGMHPIYVKAVRIDMPNGCDLMHVKRDPDIPSDSCGLGVYGSIPNALNPQPVKPLEPGDEKDYSAPRDFSKYPIHDWIMDSEDREHLWAQVVTTTKVFRQHRIFSWYTMSQTIPQKDRSSQTRKKSHK